jgi:hypothetical protein
MAHDKQRHTVSSGRYLAFDDGDDIRDDERCWSGKAFFGVLVYGAAPAALVKAMYFDAAGS